MDLNTFCRELPKIELHAHLNGSLSRATMLELKRYYADSGMEDKTNAFEEYGAGDSMNLSDCFQIFCVAHSLTTTPQALALAASLTLKEFQEDGCCYLELRSTPRDTQHMTKKEYIDTLITTIRTSSRHLTIITRLIVSINRSSSIKEAEEIAALTIEYYKSDPDVVVGIELSGNPAVGKFQDFIPAITMAREAGLKVTLHCGEVCNPTEILEMIHFMPQRIGHGIFIHPRLGGTEEIWSTLCKSKIPVEICLTSNINTKSIANYESHHFKEFYESGVPVIICTDDKGVFATSLSQEYNLCAATFRLGKSELAKLALKSCQYVFAEDIQKTLNNKLLNFIQKHEL